MKRNLSYPCAVAVKELPLELPPYLVLRMFLILCLEFGSCDFLKKAPHRYNFILGGARSPQIHQR